MDIGVENKEIGSGSMQCLNGSSEMIRISSGKEIHRQRVFNDRKKSNMYKDVTWNKPAKTMVC